MHYSDISGLSSNALFRLLHKMLIIRETEEWIAQKVGSGDIKCPCHLAVGQEAAPVALSECLTKSDRVYGTHRSHNHYLAMTDDIEDLISEILGKESGCSKGMGGSQHLIKESKGFGGSVPIVGATIPIAAGAALAMKMRNMSSVAVAFFGDGATEEGVMHETFNLAAKMQLPVCFVCENNLFASHLHILQRQTASSTVRFAQAHNINHIQLDGNDVTLLYRKLKLIIGKIRTKCVPYFVEVMTYRWKGHVGHLEDVDVGLKRSEDLEFWKQHCDPVTRLYKPMLEQALISEEGFDILKEEIRKRIQCAWEIALQAPYATEDKLLRWVYKN
ncbi:MAG: thiamine pyrophosphate-dependent dehydrogenase E1 component subunit alpha [Puniceicoccales bacterium]|jgi:pyruvate dehydrogenase E1 component alpha subunit|nr:thiamine pyrophosphate-dependent dehydrogenase E1 component subunit alpha [Puniceicoccales bacterium]